MATWIQTVTNSLYRSLLSEKSKNTIERWILAIAIGSFILHLLLIVLAQFSIFPVFGNSKLLSSPIAAIYTPFSFILLYEVYLLIYYLPKSITIYIAKQYEIITLIIIRRLFKDLSYLELSSDWFQIQGDLQFTYDLVASLILFFLLWVFYRLNKRYVQQESIEQTLTPQVKQFIKIKKNLAAIMVPVLALLAIYSFGQWILYSVFSLDLFMNAIKDVNSIFFDQFFTVLILVDVLLLLFSYTHTSEFYKIIRNSGFIISTILIRLSFGVTGLVSTLLIITAVAFGVVILWIHNRFEQMTPEPGTE